MFIEPTISWVPSGFSGYIWLDTKIVFKKNSVLGTVSQSWDFIANIFSTLSNLCSFIIAEILFLAVLGSLRRNDDVAAEHMQLRSEVLRLPRDAGEGARHSRRDRQAGLGDRLGRGTPQPPPVMAARQRLSHHGTSAAAQLLPGVLSIHIPNPHWDGEHLDPPVWWDIDPGADPGF